MAELLALAVGLALLPAEAAEAGAEAALAGPRPNSTTRYGEPSFCKRC